jgi:membrane protease YdiL (CAAX protease family)
MTELLQPESATEHFAVEPSFIEKKNIHPILFAFLSLAAVFILYQVGGGVMTFLLMEGTKINRENVNLLRLFTMLGQIFLILVPTLILARLLSTEWKTVFPLRAPSWRESVYAVIGLLSLQRVFEVYIYFQDRIPIPDVVRRLFDPIRQMLDEMVKSLLQSTSIHEFVFVVTVVAFVPAIVEEFLFRGLVQNSFNRSMKPLPAAILTGTIFGLFHLNPFEAIPLIGIGCFLGLLRYRSFSLVLPVLLHFLNNLLAIIAVTLHVGDEKIMMAPTTDQPGIMIVLAQLIIFGGLFVASMRFYWQSTAGLVEEAQ